MQRNKIVRPDEVSFGQLVSTRLHALAGISATLTTLRMKRKLNLTLLEWRAIGHLGSSGALSLKELAQKCGLDKSYASRTVTALVAKDVVVSERSEDDGRGVVLSLTSVGQNLFREGIDDAQQRNRDLLAQLSSSDQAKLIGMLETLTDQARGMLRAEKALEKL